MVGEVSYSREGSVEWRLTWRRELFMWESELLVNLMTVAADFRIGEEEDTWRWRPGEGGEFSVRSTYQLLETVWLMQDNLSILEAKVFGYLWKSKAPSKVVAFSWAMLLNQLPTRYNLAIRNVLGVETVSHLFLHCEVVWKIWAEVMFWLGFHFITPPNLFNHLECWTDEGQNKKIRCGLWLIWHACVWVIWRERNDRIFNERVKEFDELVAEIKAVSWQWSLKRLSKASYLFYEWISKGVFAKGMTEEKASCGTAVAVGFFYFLFYFLCFIFLCSGVCLCPSVFFRPV